MLHDEQRFNRDLRILTAGGLSSGLVGALMSALAGGHQHAMMAISFAGLVGLFSAFAEGEGETPLLRVLLALIGGGLAAAAFPNPVFGAVMGGAALGLALSLEQQHRDKIASAAALAVALGAGVFSSTTLVESGMLHSIDLPFVEQLAQGGIWGAFSLLGAGATQLRWRDDPHVEQLREVRDEVGGEEAHYMREAERLYMLIRGEASQKDDEELQEKSRRIAVHVLEALEALATRSNELRNALQDNPGDALEHRVQRIDDRLEQASEPSIRHELKATREDLLEQSEMRERLQTAITRLELRQQRCVTALERLHIHLVQESSIEVAERGLDASLEDLEEMASEISWRNLSVDELCDPFEGEDLGDEIDADAIRDEVERAEDLELDVDDADASDREDEATEDRTSTSSNRVERHGPDSNEREETDEYTFENGGDEAAATVASATVSARSTDDSN
jgi:hypothetical protein